MNDFEFNGNIIRCQDCEFLCLTDMWKAVGSPKGRQPSNWLRTAFASHFIDFIGDSRTVKKRFGKDELIQTFRGGSEKGKTYAYWQIAMAYAKDLSPEFQEWANRVIRGHMEERYNVSAGEGLSAALSKSDPALSALVRLGEAVEKQGNGIMKLINGQEKTDEKIDTIIVKVDTIENRLEVVEKAIEYKRKRVRKAVRDAHIEFARTTGSLCPCCGKEEIFDLDLNFTGEIEHFWKASMADIGSTWPTCRECNIGMGRGKRRGEAEVFFKAYQARLSEFNGPLFSKVSA